MPYNLLGKVLFPGRQRQERSSKSKTVVGVVFAALILGGGLGVIFPLPNLHQKPGNP